jgi:Short C-terminal domain
MRLTLADVLCPSCHGYVHPFFDRCPGCGARCPSRYRDVMNGLDLGAADMPGDPSVTGAAADSIRRTAILVALHGALSRQRVAPEPTQTGAVDPGQMIDFVSNDLTYRARGLLADPGAPVDVRLRVVADALVLSATSGGRTLASVPGETILAAHPAGGRKRGSAAWDGTWTEGARVPTTRGVPPAEFLLIHATDRGASSVSLGNQSGLFATRPSPAHYEELARWIALLAIVHAEARWRQIGAARYAAELGLVTAGGQPAGAEGLPAEGRDGSVARGAAATGRAAMLELEDLRAAGLITQPEYEEKRREILRRL